MTHDQWQELRKTAYQARLWLLKKDKAEAIKSTEQELEKLIEKLEVLAPAEHG